MKSTTFSKATMAMLAIALVIMAQLPKGSEGQGGGLCSAQLGSLNICAPYVVPGAANISPSQECCAALSGVNHECMCNTLRVASQLPSSCNLAPLNCGN